MTRQALAAFIRAECCNCQNGRCVGVGHKTALTKKGQCGVLVERRRCGHFETDVLPIMDERCGKGASLEYWNKTRTAVDRQGV